MRPDALVTPNRKGHWSHRLSDANLTPCVYQPPLTLTQEVLDQLAQLSGASRLLLGAGLLANRYNVFRVGTLLVLTAVVGEVLRLEAIIQQGPSGQYFRSLAQQMIKLASSWNCTSVETSTRDPRVAKLMQLVGAKQVEWTVALEV